MDFIIADLSHRRGGRDERGGGRRRRWSSFIGIVGQHAVLENVFKDCSGVHLELDQATCAWRHLRYRRNYVCKVNPCGHQRRPDNNGGCGCGGGRPDGRRK